MGQFGISQPVKRIEDPALLRGDGCFTDDAPVARLAHGVMLRSPYAHAAIERLDVTAAAGLPGVLLVLTARDIERAGVAPIACVAQPRLKPGTSFTAHHQPALAKDRVRFCGEGIAFVVAESPEQARDAAERIEVELAPEAAVTDCAGAYAEDAQPVWPDAARNVCFEYQAGDARAVAAAFDRAAHRVALDLVNNRVMPSPLETRGALGGVERGRLVLHTGTQMPHPLRDQIAAAFALEREQVRVVVTDVGGGFGGKNSLYPEQICVLEAARRLGRPVKWISDRTEACLADFHGRDNVSHAELALDADHRILAIRVRTFANLGAYIASRGAVSPLLATMMTTNLYDIPCMHVEGLATYTHTVPTDPYRGAGRPEMTYLVERLMDHAARALDVDPIALRKTNLIPPHAFPYTTPSGLEYDPCQFEPVMDAALADAGWDTFPVRRAAAEARGRLRGIGVSSYVERCGGGGGLSESASISVGTDRRVTLLIGSMANGQGHRTAYAQILCETLGIELDDVRVVQGDTDRIASGIGTGGSWSIPMGGAACADAAGQLVRRLMPAAAEALEAAPQDVAFDQGRYRVVGTDLSTPLLDVAARAAPGEPAGQVVETARFTPRNYTFPYGCHVCEVEVDPETGKADIVAYSAVHDFGRPLNPLLLAGQVHGGVAQGIGQALLERTVYDDDGQLLSGSLMDYALPRADDLPAFRFVSWETPAPANPLDIKGCGEAGATGSPPAVVNAIVDALRARGVVSLDMPATPERVWRALHNAQKKPADGAGQEEERV